MTGRFSRLLLVVLLVLLPLAASAADSLEVRRDANVYKEPDRKSEQVTRIILKEGEGPYFLRLAQDSSVNGYYKVRLPGNSKTGWIYKSYVRRVQGQHPQFQPYKRALYRHWIDEDGDCQNTRNEVLIRDGREGSIRFKDQRECEVASGTWVDPYTGKTFRIPKELDVDHVVPLKNAHDSGAWAWSSKRRQEYANSLQFNKHLLAVSASENRKKGDKGPDRYVPPRKEYHCEYVRTWVEIKTQWELEMTEAEGETVEKILAGCP